MRAMAAVLLTVLAGACSSVPARYSAENLARIGSELNTADAIYAELGTASLERENGRLRIYTWQDNVLNSSRSLLVLEFDADGRLLNREVAREVKPTHGWLDRYPQSARYCTAGGTCIEHGVYGDDGIYYDYEFSAVTVQGTAKSRVQPAETREGECTLVIWPGDGWSESRSTIQTPYGLALSVDGAPKWSQFRWVPTGAFARIAMPAGDHVVSVRDPAWDERMSNRETPPEDRPPTWPEVAGEILTPRAEHDLPPGSAPFHCWSGDQRFLTINAVFVEKAGEHWFPIVLRSMEPAEAQALMSKMALVLPPEN